MTEAVKKKIQARTGHKLFVRKTINLAKDLIESQDAEVIPKLESAKSTLEKQRKDIESLDGQIIEGLSEEHVEKEIMEKCEFEAAIQDTISLIEHRLKKDQNATPEQQFSSTASSGQDKSSNQLKVRLPKLSLPDFSGTPTEWTPFWDSFSSSIHDNQALHDVDKFQYLKSLLKGTAADTISGLSLTNANYQKAVELLRERFENKQLIISHHVDSLFKLPLISSSNDLVALRQLYDKTESAVRSLQSVGIETSTYGTFLTPILMAKLPSEFRLLVSRNLSEEWDLVGVLKQFESELKLRERCNLSAVSESTKSYEGKLQRFSNNEKQRSNSTTATLQVTTDKQNGPWCTYCKGDHPSAKCNSVTDPSSRKAILRQKGKCFICLKSNHLSRECKNKRKCFKCNGSHYTSICGSYENPRSTNHPPTSQTTPQTVSTNLYFARDIRNSNVLLQTARARVGSPHSEMPTGGVRILFDSCSQKSYISARLREKLALPTMRTDRILVKTFGKDEGSLKVCDVVQVAIECRDGMKIFVNSYVVPLICSPITNQTIDITQAQYPHLRDLPLSDQADGNEDLEVDIMIGADYYWCFIQNQVVRGEASYGPVAILSRLGYILSGPANTPSKHETFANVTISHVMRTDTIPVNTDIELKKELRRFWDYETLGVKEKEVSVHEDFIGKIKFDGNRYEVSLPFKQHHPQIPDNFSSSRGRLKSLFNRLEPEVLCQYDNVITEQLNSGIVEFVDEENDIQKAGNVHYLPHKEVIRSDKSTTKLRVVYDASSKRHGEVSLNDCLHQGPSLVPMIFDILLRFRMNKIALVGDIEKAFLNIAIKPEERDFLRFLWVDDVNSEEPQLIKLRFTRLVFGLVSSPFILNATIQHHLQTFATSDPEFVRNVINSLYVDDYASGKDSENDCFELYKKLKHCFHTGGFNMRKWSSNSETLNKMINESEFQVTKSDLVENNESYCKSTLNNVTTCSIEESKVLGIPWNRILDKLCFKFSTIVDQATTTPFLSKRVLLSISSRFYDPLGLLAPIMVPFKHMFQAVCKSNLDWDAPLPEDLNKRWNELVDDMKQVGSIEIPRCITTNEPVKSFELHGFADASKIAYGANVYLRVRTSSSISSKLIASKTRIAPLKLETIPRLELSAALLLSQLIIAVSESLGQQIEIDRKICWIDSQVVLWWIYGENKQFKQFVENRVLTIRKRVNKENWRYCPTNLNPSDIASRGAKCSEIEENLFWWEGPKYLKESEEFWPNILNCPTKNEEIPPDAKKEIKTESECTAVFVNKVATNPVSLENVIACEDYSCLGRLLRVTAFVLRFIKKIKEKTLKKSDSFEITIDELESAKTLWYKHVQSSFAQNSEFEQANRHLRVFKDEIGVMRCRGRIGNASVAYSTKFPVLLPRKHHFTELVVRQCHKSVYHNGLRESLTQLRTNYWVIKGRQLVKKIIHRCVVCKKLQGKSYSTPPSPPLPEFRVSEEHAFSNVAVDHAGPLYVKNIYMKGDEMHKCYLALFTCSSTRAIHLELSPDLTGNAFLRAFKRLIGRRGLPVVMNSDNGRTFRDSKVKAYCLEKNKKWKFNVPKASWWGGHFEVCIKLVKRCLRKTLGNAKLTYEELETVLVEIEGVLNSRPLTYFYNELTEPPLTPSSLVMGRRLLDQSGVGETSLRQTAKTVSKRARHLEQLLRHFRNRWKREYLTGLREYQRQKFGELKRVIKVGDMVHVHEDKLPRQRWRMGKVIKLLTGLNPTDALHVPNLLLSSSHSYQQDLQISFNALDYNILNRTREMGQQLTEISWSVYKAKAGLGVALSIDENGNMYGATTPFLDGTADSL